MFASRVLRDLVRLELNSTTGVATVILNNPNKLNAMTTELGDEFEGVINLLKSKRSEVRATVITSVC